MLRHLLFVFVASCFAGCKTAPPAITAQQRLADSRAQWSRLETVPYKGKQDDVFFLTPELGWYGNGEGKIYKTSDGGKTWTLKLHQPGTFFRAIGFLDEQHGFAGNLGTEYFPGVTDETPLYETFDGGETWAVAKDVPLPKGAGVCAIDIVRNKFINAGELQERTLVHIGGRVGGPAYLLRSLDAGKSWRLVDLNANVAMILDVKFFDANVGFVAAGSDRETERSHAVVLRTEDGGRSWHRAYESSRPFELIWKLSFPSREVGYGTVMTYDPNANARFVAKTVDGGKTWSELPLVTDAKVQEYGIGFVSPEVGWVGAKQGGFQTLDGGKTWTHVEMGRAVNKVRILHTPEGFVGYAIGADLYKLDARSVPRG